MRALTGRLGRIGLITLLTVVCAASSSAATLPPLPHGWPKTLQIGLTDAPGGARALRASAPFGFRYQYLAGGVNTGPGWTTWNPDGSFVTRYVRESRAARVIPVFTYYQLLQSKPGGGDEAHADLANLRDPATMQAYWADAATFFRRARGHEAGRAARRARPLGLRRAGRDTATPRAFRRSSRGCRRPRPASRRSRALRDRLAPNVILA